MKHLPASSLLLKSVWKWSKFALFTFLRKTVLLCTIYHCTLYQRQSFCVHNLLSKLDLTCWDTKPLCWRFWESSSQLTVNSYSTMLWSLLCMCRTHTHSNSLVCIVKQFLNKAHNLWNVENVKFLCKGKPNLPSRLRASWNAHFISTWIIWILKLWFK